MSIITAQKEQLQYAQMRSGNYFLWIAGFTLLNTAIDLFTSGRFGFAIALGVVDFANAIVSSKAIAVGFACFMAAIFGLFGWFARQGNVAVFIVGMIFYALDGLLLLVVKDWMAIAFHAYILYKLFNGIQYSLALKKLIAEEESDLLRQRVTGAEPWQR